MISATKLQPLRPGCGFTRLHPEKPRLQVKLEGQIKFQQAEKPRPLGRDVTGFTFIELMIVIIIIGVLASISTPRFKKSFAEFELNRSLRQLQTFISFLHQRSVIERKIIRFNVDNQEKEYWAQIKDNPRRLKSYSFAEDFNLKVKKITDPQEESILFYPDGAIDAVTIEISAPDGMALSITTEGVFGGSRIKDKDD